MTEVRSGESDVENVCAGSDEGFTDSYGEMLTGYMLPCSVKGFQFVTQD